MAAQPVPSTTTLFFPCVLGILESVTPGSDLSSEYETRPPPLPLEPRKAQKNLQVTSVHRESKQTPGNTALPYHFNRKARSIELFRPRADTYEGAEKRDEAHRF